MIRDTSKKDGKILCCNSHDRPTNVVQVRYLEG
jgi:hypothetical protein